MKKIILLSFLFLCACQDDGGGVVRNDFPGLDPDTVYGGPVENDEVIIPPPPVVGAMDSSELQLLIFNANNGETITLDRDLNLNQRVIVNKNITLDLGENKAQAINTSVAFEVDDFILTIENGEIELINSSLLSDLSTSEVEISSVDISLRGNSRITSNGSFILFDSSVVGYSAVQKNFPLVYLRGSNSSISESVLLDYSEKYETTLLLENAEDVSIVDNIINCYCIPQRGAISFRNSTNIFMSSNILHDRNIGKENGAITGSIGIAFEESDTVSDAGLENFSSAEIKSFDDSDTNGSLNVNLSATAASSPINLLSADDTLDIINQETVPPSVP